MYLIFFKLVRFGTLPRYKLKNNLRSLASLVRQGLVRKVISKINKPMVAILPVKPKNSGKKLEANKVNELNNIIIAEVLFLVL